jgi:hypothetical protein
MGKKSTAIFAARRNLAYAFNSPGGATTLSDGQFPAGRDGVYRAGDESCLNPTQSVSDSV